MCPEAADPWVTGRVGGFGREPRAVITSYNLWFCTSTCMQSHWIGTPLDRRVSCLPQWDPAALNSILRLGLCLLGHCLALSQQQRTVGLCLWGHCGWDRDPNLNHSDCPVVKKKHWLWRSTGLYHQLVKEEEEEGSDQEASPLARKRKEEMIEVIQEAETTPS